MNNFTFHLKTLGEEKQTKPKISSRKEIIKIGVDIKEIENRKTIDKINETKNWFLEEINKVDKLLAIWTKKKRFKWIHNYRNISTEIKDYKRVL